MIIEGAIYNEEGQVAMRYMQQAQALVTCNGNNYVFVVKAQTIALAYVEPDDVACMLGFKKGCGGCGGRKKNVIFLADETHVRRWESGGGR
ncbi:MAG: hypothetical protein K940chlam2_00036 [Chlamydiae bacterium]|nr:hypothetical protein [Chlamydiota bacterium]